MYKRDLYFRATVPNNCQTQDTHIRKHIYANDMYKRVLHFRDTFPNKYQIRHTHIRKRYIQKRPTFLVPALNNCGRLDA